VYSKQRRETTTQNSEQQRKEHMATSPLILVVSHPPHPGHTPHPGFTAALACPSPSPRCSRLPVTGPPPAAQAAHRRKTPTLRRQGSQHHGHKHGRTHSTLPTNSQHKPFGTPHKQRIAAPTTAVGAGSSPARHHARITLSIYPTQIRAEYPTQRALLTSGGGMRGGGMSVVARSSSERAYGRGVGAVLSFSRQRRRWA
jgi:hypothetical protein